MGTEHTTPPRHQSAASSTLGTVPQQHPLQYHLLMVSPAAPSLTPLELPAWVDFVAEHNGLHVEHLNLSPGSNLGRAILFLDRRKRIKQPTHMPYLPVVFRPSKRRAYSRTVQWHQAATVIIDRMRTAGVANHLWLPPEIDDVRPWSWLGFHVQVAYSYVVDFPWDSNLANNMFRRAVAKAEKNGVRVERTTDAQAIMTCIAATEARQGFATGVTPSDFAGLLRRLGDNLLAFVATSADGQPLAADVILHVPGQHAYLWMAGVTQDGMAVRAHSLSTAMALHLTAAAGATGIELRGANSLQMSQNRGQIGGRLVPHYGVRPYSVRAAVRFGLDWMHSRARRSRRLDNSQLE